MSRLEPQVWFLKFLYSFVNLLTILSPFRPFIPRHWLDIISPRVTSTHTFNLPHPTTMPCLLPFRHYQLHTRATKRRQPPDYVASTDDNNEQRTLVKQRQSVGLVTRHVSSPRYVFFYNSIDSTYSCANEGQVSYLLNTYQYLSHPY